MHFFAVHYSRSDDPRRRRAARNADAALSNWNLGLRNGTKPALLLQNSSVVLEADDVQLASSTTRSGAPSISPSPKRFQGGKFYFPVEFEQAMSDFPTSKWKIAMVNESPAAEETGKYTDGASDGSNHHQTLPEGWSGQAPPSTGGQAREQRHGMDGHISRLGSSGQAPPVLSEQAQGQRDGTGGQASHGGSNGQVLPPSSGQAQGQRDGTGGQASHGGSNGRVLPPVERSSSGST